MSLFPLAYLDFSFFKKKKFYTIYGSVAFFSTIYEIYCII